MTSTIVWITGASSGIGQALARTVPFPDARVIDISRSGGTPGTEHVRADLSDPASWAAVEEHMMAELDGFTGAAVFVHNAGTLDPIGFAGTVDSERYRSQVVLNAAAPAVLGHAFLRAVDSATVDAHLLMLSSGAASSPYAGWSAYCSGKAAVDMWVRCAGIEQDQRAARGESSCTVLAVAPGVVATAMQEQIRQTSDEQFPNVTKFQHLYDTGQLRDPQDAARDVWSLLDRDLDNGAVIDLRSLGSAQNPGSPGSPGSPANPGSPA